MKGEGGNIGGSGEVSRERIAGGSSRSLTGFWACETENGTEVVFGCEDIALQGGW